MERLETFSRQPLGFLPTPVAQLPRISEALGGPEIWIKRDDQTGLATGGNKTRKLEYLIGAALAAGADCVITGGAQQSNHCRQTAAASAASGLDCHLVLGGEAPRASQGNLLFSQLLGAKIHWSGENRRGEDIPALEAQLKAAGRRPYVIPYGGSNAVGALGFVRAAAELEEQSHTLAKPFTHIIFASSSGGTQAGLLAGARLIGATYAVMGVSIEKPSAEGTELQTIVETLLAELSTLLGTDLPAASPQQAQYLMDYSDAGYGVVTDQERNAIELLAHKEGILLDPVYSGRAFAALIAQVQGGAFRSDHRLLFWHTGGSAALPAYNEALCQEGPG